MAAPLILPFGGKAPRIHASAFIAPGAVIVGDVEIGPDASIWYNCVVRGDVNAIRIGARTNVQDGSVIHVESNHDGGGGCPTIIGDDVLIGHMALVHGCTLRDRAFVGMGAIVMDRCTIKSDGMLAAGAMLTPGKQIGPSELWGGRPARLMRTRTPADLAATRDGAASYVAEARLHMAALKAR